MPKVKIHKERACIKCGEIFIPKSGFQKYCGNRDKKIGCASKSRKDYQRKYLREYQKNRRKIDPEYKERLRTWTEKWRDSNRFWIKQYSKGYWKKIPTEFKLKQLADARKRYSEKRELLIKKYGGVCVCCNEDRKEFLAINHINGGGRKERKRIGQRKMYQNMLEDKYKNKYNILCHNCNQALGFYGYCPHKNNANK